MLELIKWGHHAITALQAIVDIANSVKPIGCKYVFNAMRDCKGNIDLFTRLCSERFFPKEELTTTKPLISIF